jgi:hypothetical protein
MVRAVKKLKAAANPQTTFFCLSNANSVFISTILEVCCALPLFVYFTHFCSQSKGLQTLFDEIVTNPAEWDSSGLLKLRRKIDPSGPQHSCKVGCSANMCKGTCLSCVCTSFEAHCPFVQERSWMPSSSGTSLPLTVLYISETDLMIIAPLYA